MGEILFIGPVAETGGPAIKNRILLEFLQKNAAIKVWNTYDKSLKARLGSITSILFTKQKFIIIAVSRKGRNLLYPFLRFKSRISGCKYSCIVIGGQAVESFKNNASINALKDADVVTVETLGLKKQMEEAFDLMNVHWMPNFKELPSEDDYDIPQGKYMEDTLRLIFLSSMRNPKGIKSLIEAYKKTRRIGTKIVLDFYGPIKSDFDETLLDEMVNIEGIKYCGVVQNSEVLQIMQDYHVFVFPTEYQYEGFPAVLVEAMAVGLPVIASDINYNPEIIQDGVNGYIFEHGQIDQLTAKIQYCVEHRSELLQIAERNRHDVRQYDAATVADTYIQRLKSKGWPL